MDVNLKSVAEALRDSTIQLEEVAFDLSRYLDKLDLDPGELVEVNDRLNTINRLLNKYGDPLETTLAYRQEIGKKIIELERATDDFSSLQSQLAPLLSELKKMGEELSQQRRAVAGKLGPLIERQLAELGYGKGQVPVSSLSPADADDRRRNASGQPERIRSSWSSSPRPIPASFRSRFARSLPAVS